MGGQAFPARLNAGLRRVTTGVDAQGKAVVVADEQITGDERSLVIWQRDTPPAMGKPDSTTFTCLKGRARAPARCTAIT